MAVRKIRKKTKQTRPKTGRVQVGDCVKLMAGMPEAFVDAIITDPPYGLGFMGKAWDSLPPGKDVAEQMLRVLVRWRGWIGLGVI